MSTDDNDDNPDYEVTTATVPTWTSGCGAQPMTGEEAAVAMYRGLLTDEDKRLLRARGVDPDNLRADRTNETYRPLFAQGSGTYFVVADFGLSRFTAVLLDVRAEGRIIRVLNWGSRWDRFTEYWSRVWTVFWDWNFNRSLRRAIRRRGR